MVRRESECGGVSRAHTSEILSALKQLVAFACYVPVLGTRLLSKLILGLAGVNSSPIETPSAAGRWKKRVSLVCSLIVRSVILVFRV